MTAVKMTPERRKEIDEQIAWWSKVTNWRINGFNTKATDPLFTTHPVTSNKPDGKTLHVMSYGSWGEYIWLEHGTQFEFTGRITYKIDSGDFKDMLLEIRWFQPRTKLFGIWKRQPEICTAWKYDFDFDDKYPHVLAHETIIVDC